MQRKPVDNTRRYLILALVLLAGVGLSLFLYRKTGGMLIFIIPIIGIGGSLFTRMLRRQPVRRREDTTAYDDYKHRVRYRVTPEDEHSDDEDKA
jgi:hypothetical protein